MPFKSIFHRVNAIERSIAMDMDGNFNPVDSFVKELMGNIRFLEKMLNTTNIILGVLGLVVVIGVVVAVVHFL